MLARLVWAARRIVHRIEYRRGRRLLSLARQRWVVFSHPRATIRFGDRVYVGPGFSVDIPANGTLIVGDDCEFRRNCRVEIPGDGRITIGNGSYLTYNVVLACSRSITIGERCGIGNNCGVYDANHKYRDLTRPFLEQGYVYRAVTIADDVQIHSNSVIVNTIGTRTIIGANSVVTKPIPPYVLATGAPATPIDEFGP